MSIQSLKKGCRIAVVVYIILAAAFYWIGGEQLHFRDNQTDMLAPTTPIGEITADVVVTQNIQVDGEYLTGLTLIGATYARQNTGVLRIEILSEGSVIETKEVDIASMTDGGEISITFNPILSVPSEVAQIRITAPESSAGNAITLYSGNTMSTARTQVEVGINQDNLAYVNGTALDSALCVRVYSRETLWFGDHYTYIVTVCLILLLLYCANLIYRVKRKKRSFVINVCVAFSKYRYLIKQLILRDFKTKYKRSVLGAFWSLLNPLLTMIVQYTVFSTLFKSDIPNYALYLLTGIVCFNFFNEATNMALQSIVGNVGLITKVYIPKYIFPISRVLSTTINLLLSMIPLFVVMIATRTAIRSTLLLLPFGIICLVAFCIGVGCFLSIVMVYFRDAQFLWSVISMLWMYITPVFYPESIIPQQLSLIYKLNPLYHIIRLIRTILIDGVSPEPKAFGLCLIASFVPLIIGLVIFKKYQDNIVLNL